jgi:hypothetical protein
MIDAAGAFYIARILWPMLQPDIASDIERMLDPSICVPKASEHSSKDLDEKSEIFVHRAV